MHSLGSKRDTRWYFVFSLGTPCLLPPGDSEDLGHNQGAPEWQRSAAEFLQLRICWICFHTFTFSITIPFPFLSKEDRLLFQRILGNHIFGCYFISLWFIMFFLIVLSVLRFVVTCPFPTLFHLPWPP